MRTTHQGFTLIELVLIVVLLGILASISIPRVVQLNKKSHVEKIERLRNSLQEAVDAVHERWQKTKTTKVVMENNKFVYVNNKGWPTIDDNHVDQNTARKFFHKLLGKKLLQKQFQTSQKPAAHGGEIRYQIRSECYVHYNAETGQATMVSAGC